MPSLAAVLLMPCKWSLGFGCCSQSNCAGPLQESMLQLWCHETFRIIGDRMWDAADKVWLHTQLDNSLKNIFGTSWDDTFGAGQDCPPFVSFMRPVENPPYEPVTDMNALKVRQ